jgi:hypothetical protein
VKEREKIEKDRNQERDGEKRRHKDIQKQSYKDGLYRKRDREKSHY